VDVKKLLALGLVDDKDCDASVVVLIAKGEYVLVIKRTSNPKDPWSGQMALPGGRREPNETSLQTAVRECEEEVGITPNIKSTLGIFSPNNVKLRVRAYVALTDEIMEPKPNPAEVEKVFWIHETEFIRRDDAFYYDQYRIWGMTYRILSKLFEVSGVKV